MMLSFGGECSSVDMIRNINKSHRPLVVGPISLEVKIYADSQSSTPGNLIGFPGISNQTKRSRQDIEVKADSRRHGE